MISRFPGLPLLAADPAQPFNGQAWYNITDGAFRFYEAGAVKTLAAAGGGAITLTGDVTGSGTGSLEATLAASGVTAATYGSATQSAQIAVDAKGRVTSAGNVTIAPAWGSVTGRPAGLLSLAGASTLGLYQLSAADTWSPVVIGSGLSLSGGTLSATGGGGGGGVDEIAFNMPDSGELLQTMVTASSGNLPNTPGVLDQIRLYPYLARASMTISELVCRCGTLATGGLAKLVVYSSDALGRPDSLLFEGGDLDFSAAGARASPASLSIVRGTTYWLGIRTNSAASYWGCSNGSTPTIQGGTATVQTARVSLTRTVAYASPAPATWGWNAGDISNSTPPHIWLRRA